MKNLYIIRAWLARDCQSATVWVGCRCVQGLDIWQWEILRILWQSMGTAATAAWVAEQYVGQHPAGLTERSASALTAAVQQALLAAERA